VKDEYHPKQANILSRSLVGQNSILVCGRGFGKSICGRGLVYLNAVNYQGVLPPQGKTKFYNVIAMPALPQAKKIHWEPLYYLFTETPLANLVRSINRSECIINLKGDRPGIILTGLNDDNGDKVRGLSIPKLVIDEFQDVKPGIWSSLKPAVDRCSGSALVCGTPKGKGTYFHKFCKEMIQLGWKYYNYGTADNPYLPNIEKILEEAQKGLTKREYNCEYLASWEDFPGQIYDCLEEDNIILEEDNIIDDSGVMTKELDSYVMGIDWGDINPAIAIVGLKDFPYKYYLVDFWEGNPDGSNNSIVFDELKRIASEYAEKYNIHSVYPDVFQPGNIDFISEFAMTPGLNNIVEPQSEDYQKMRSLQVMPSMAMLNRLFKQKRFFISSKIEHQFRAIVRKRDRWSGAYTDELDKSSRRHINDACRYAVANIENTLNLMYGYQ